MLPEELTPQLVGHNSPAFQRQPLCQSRKEKENHIGAILIPFALSQFRSTCDLPTITSFIGFWVTEVLVRSPGGTCSELRIRVTPPSSATCGRETNRKFNPSTTAVNTRESVLTVELLLFFYYLFFFVLFILLPLSALKMKE
ncbi:hypothetical protein NE237_003654 [Protea cynaroides]|uniref:Uncharacterized protein n=1 Tax=Protea cynaroides TaxID=273540 RepID=A0A9Q0QSM7_9MAGN|nr:hypothetical protein NE237_003654 [Protea cynaroides]